MSIILKREHECEGEYGYGGEYGKIWRENWKREMLKLTYNLKI